MAPNGFSGDESDHTRSERTPIMEQMRSNIENLLGEMTESQWEGIAEAFSELREEIDQMQWFSMGPNSVGYEKEGTRYSEFVLAPKDRDHEARLLDILARLKIFPWGEKEGNVSVLVIENRRDITLLREGLVFDYLNAGIERAERERVVELLLEAQRQAEAERLREEEVRLGIERERQAEEERVQRMDLENAEFRQRAQAEREQRIISFIATLPPPREEDFVAPDAIEDDQFYRFGFHRPGSRIVAGRSPKDPNTLPVENEDPVDVYTDAEEMERRFSAGELNEESIEAELRGERGRMRSPMMPVLALFPRVYEWIKIPGKKEGFLRHRASGETISDELVESYVMQAQRGGRRERNLAIRELCLMQRQFILYLIREVQKRHPHGDPDDLFQEAFFGFIHAIDHYDPEDPQYENSSFRSYFAKCVDGALYTYAPNARFRAIRPPVNQASDRKKVLVAQKMFSNARPDKAVEPKDVARLLFEQGITKSKSLDAFDQYLRKVLLAYEEVSLSELEDLAMDEVAMTGELARVDAPQDTAVDQIQLAEVITRSLATLTPREERIVRLRFGLTTEIEDFAVMVYQSLGDEFGMSREDALRKVYELTGKGSLTSERVIESLSPEDKAFARRYRELTNLHSPNEGMSLRELAEISGVSPERIRQMEAKALRKLKHPARSRGLRYYLPD